MRGIGIQHAEQQLDGGYASGGDNDEKEDDQSRRAHCRGMGGVRTANHKGGGGGG